MRGGTWTTRGAQGDRFLPTIAVGRLSAALFILCGGLVAVLGPLLPAPPDSSPAGQVAVGVGAVVTGAVIAVLPWRRWRLASTLWLVVPALATVVAYNLVSGNDGFRYALFFVVIFVWLGLGHPRWTSVRLLPAVVVVYVVPLVVTHAGAAGIASVAYVAPTCALLGETVAWVSEHLARSEQRFRSLVQHATDVITVVDRTGAIVYDSPALERVLGYRPSDRAGAMARTFIHPDDRARLDAALPAARRRGEKVAAVEVRHQHADGSYRWCSAVLQDLLDHPAVAGVVANFRDVTAEREVQERLRHQASHDPLTGLANRSAVVERLDGLLRADPAGAPVAVLLLDLDRFKIVNDSLGHGNGDRLLSAVAGRLRAQLPADRVVARLGGDEFVAVLPGADQGAAVEVAATFVRALAMPFALAGREVAVSASIGVVAHAGGVTSADELLRDADAAMYAAKRNGGRGWRLFEPAMHDAAVEALELESRLRRALVDGQFELHYQPLVDLASGRPRGAEALVRWRHPESGLVPPGAFVPLAEDTGLIVDIGRWVLGEACRQLATWHAAGRHHLEIGVNLSGRQLEDQELVPTVADAVAATGIPPDRLVLEITESALVRDVEAAAERLRVLKGLGVRLAIDDFGTGQSSLSYLRSFPVDILKIDRSFIAQVTDDGRSAAFVEAILGLGRALDLATVAEGIETEAQRHLLTAFGCDIGQGFHLGRPEPAPAAEAALLVPVA